jgi:hypothetical protein
MVSTHADFNLDLSVLGDPRNLVVGFLDAEFSGTGTLTLSIIAGPLGEAVFDESFTDLAVAADFFDDRLLDLGIFPAVSSDLVQLTFAMTFTSDDPTARFASQMIFASVPEPAPALLLLFGLALLSRSRARRV